ncbi:hypothetical protein EWH23_08855, partial [Meiothermus sp. PNK-Is4]
MTGIHLGWRAALLLLALVACRSQPPAVSPAAQGASSPPPTTVGLELKAGLPGMPPYDPKDVYAFTR